MATPTFDQFLLEIARILREKNGAQLQDVLIVEPPWKPLYEATVAELKRVFPASGLQDTLEEKCKTVLPPDGGADGESWSSFVIFLVKYFSFLRDVDVTHLVETHDMLKALLKLVLPIVSQCTHRFANHRLVKVLLLSVYQTGL